MADIEKLLQKIQESFDPIWANNNSYAIVKEEEEAEDERETELEGNEKEAVPEEEGEETVGDEEEQEGELEDTGEEVPETTDAGMEGMGDAMDPMAMPGEEPPKTSEELGRVYELKKIYSRLISMESYLSDTTDIVLIKMRNFVSQAIGLFETLISNVDSFKDKIDDIIVLYYQFLERLYEVLLSYYRVRDEEE